MQSMYKVVIEVSGKLAMFTRPDTGGTPTSYPVPTWSASKGIFESIAFLESGDAWVMPTKVEICRFVDDATSSMSYQQYTTNYGGPLRKKALMINGVTSGGSGMQFFATILSNVCYRIHGIVVGPPSNGRANARHYLQDLFNRRLKQGRCFRTPCLGWSEFTCSYWGPFRCREIGGMSNRAWQLHCDKFGLLFADVTEVDESIDLEIPSMLKSMWTAPTSGGYEPEFVQGVKVDRGVMSFLTSDSMEGNDAE